MIPSLCRATGRCGQRGGGRRADACGGGAARVERGVRVAGARGRRVDGVERRRGRRRAGRADRVLACAREAHRPARTRRGAREPPRVPPRRRLPAPRAAPLHSGYRLCSSCGLGSGSLCEIRNVVTYRCNIREYNLPTRTTHERTLSLRSSKLQDYEYKMLNAHHQTSCVDAFAHSLHMRY